jgi:hypothetical protein
VWVLALETLRVCPLARPIPYYLATFWGSSGVFTSMRVGILLIMFKGLTVRLIRGRRSTDITIMRNVASMIVGRRITNLKITSSLSSLSLICSFNLTFSPFYLNTTEVHSKRPPQCRVSTEDSPAGHTGLGTRPAVSALQPADQPALAPLHHPQLPGDLFDYSPGT